MAVPLVAVPQDLRSHSMSNVVGYVHRATLPGQSHQRLQSGDGQAVRPLLEAMLWVDPQDAAGRNPLSQRRQGGFFQSAWELARERSG